MCRKIEVTNEEPALTISLESVEKCLAVLDHFEKYPVPDGCVSIAFVTRDNCSKLHADFFDDPSPTDVMTFPGEEEDSHAGDIAICPGVAAEQCIRENTTFEEELTLYLVHAWLHLAGLTDKDPDSIRSMRMAESTLMEHLRNQSALLSAQWLEAN